MQKPKQELNEKPVGATIGRLHFKEMTLKNQKGITLIALIITIIVMLILVGVTINVALNGGLFEKGEKAAFQTGASAVKEQLEIEKASKVMENGGKPLKDYSGITVGSLTGLDEKTQEKYGNKILVDKTGNICYDPAKVTDEEEKTWLEELGIMPKVSGPVDPYENLYNIAYATVIEESIAAEIVLYKNGMYTFRYPSWIPGMSLTGTYVIDGQTLELKYIFSEETRAKLIISEDMNLLTFDDDSGAVLTRDNSKTDNYNPEFTDSTKGIYKNALYINENETNAISVSEKYIHLEQEYIADTGRIIELSSFEKGNNEKLSVNEDGTVITYNGEDYRLITKEQMNSAT